MQSQAHPTVASQLAHTAHVPVTPGAVLLMHISSASRPEVGVEWVGGRGAGRSLHLAGPAGPPGYIGHLCTAGRPSAEPAATSPECAAAPPDLHHTFLLTFV